MENTTTGSVILIGGFAVLIPVSFWVDRIGREIKRILEQEQVEVPQPYRIFGVIPLKGSGATTYYNKFRDVGLDVTYPEVARRYRRVFGTMVFLGIAWLLTLWLSPLFI